MISYSLRLICQVGQEQRSRSLTAVRLKEIRAVLGLGESVAATILKRLEKNGLITRRKDGREVQVSLTAQGAGVIDEMRRTLLTPEEASAAARPV
jgi:DNA-binding MarR family transcriptional regulator